MNGTDITLERYLEPAATVHVTTGSGGNPEMIDKVGPDPECSPRCPTHVIPSCIKSSGILCRGEHRYTMHLVMWRAPVQHASCDAVSMIHVAL